jgi:LuxR family maltose regulon positive regulatory protein
VERVDCDCSTMAPRRHSRTLAPRAPRRAALKVRALGSLHITRDDAPIDESAWRRRKSRTLFAYLLCARPRGVHKEQLIELLWPGADPVHSNHALQVALSDLRAVLGNGSGRRGGRPFLCRSGDAYSLDVGPSGWIDAEAFEAECEAGRRAAQAGEVAEAVAHLRVAESLYGGDFLADEVFSDWAAARRERHRDEYLGVLAYLLRHHEREGRVEAAADYARKALDADPYLEPFYRDLMRLNAALGDRAGALRAYVRCVEMMREGFDSEVSVETKTLAKTLLGASIEVLPRRPGPGRLPRRREHEEPAAEPARLVRPPDGR